jgi:hypothetical protein
MAGSLHRIDAWESLKKPRSLDVKFGRLMRRDSKRETMEWRTRTVTSKLGRTESRVVNLNLAHVDTMTQVLFSLYMKRT